MSENEEFEVFITKYLFTEGITRRIVRLASANMVCIGKAGYMSRRYFHGKDWHRDESSAIEQAQEMKSRKIRSLEKQLRKVREIEISIPPAEAS